MTRESRCSLRAVRLGEASHPGPPKRGRVRNRFVVLSSDDEEWVPRTVPASRREGDQPESRHVVSEPPEVFPMTDDSEVGNVPQRRGRRLVDTDNDSEASPVEVVRSRRLVIVGAQTQVDPVEPTVPDPEPHHTSDTESFQSRGGISDMEGEVEVASVLEPPVPIIVAPVERFNRSFEWLAGVDLEVVFSQRPSLMKSVPGFMRGACRSAMRVALTEIDQGRSDGDSSRSSRVGNSSSCSHGSGCTNLHEVARCQRSSYRADSNLSLVAIGHISWPRVLIALLERNLEARAARAESLTQMGEANSQQPVSCWREQLWHQGSGLLLLRSRILRDAPRDPVPPNILNVNPVEQFSLDMDVFSSTIRSARRRAAGGPSGMTAEHLRLVLESPRSLLTSSLCCAQRTSCRSAEAWWGRAGIVCGDLVRKLVARSIAQQISSAVAEATSPFQCALTTKASGESVAPSNLSQTWTVVPPSMLDGLQQVRGGDTVLPFVVA